MVASASSASKGRPRKAPALRLIEGSAVPSDEGLTAEVLLPRGEPTKPDFWGDDDAETMWDRVVELMRGGKLLKPLDAYALELMCQCYSRWRAAITMRMSMGITHETSQGTSAAPWVGVEERAAREFRGWCAEFGITPAAERNLMGSDEKPGDADNPFA